MDYFQILSVEPPWTDPKPEMLREKVEPFSVRGAGAPARCRAGLGGRAITTKDVISASVWYCSISLRFVKQAVHKDQSYLSIIELLQLL